MSIFSLAWHFFTSMARVQWWKLRGREVLAGPEDQGIRNLFCTHCEEYDEGVCRACGCLTAAKISLNSEQCPKGYWPRRYEKKNSGS